MDGPGPFDQILAVLLANGPLGLFCAYLIWQGFQKDRRIDTLTDRAADREAAMGTTLTEIKLLVQTMIGGK